MPQLKSTILIILFLQLLSIVNCDDLICIKDIDKKTLLKELWKNQKIASIFKKFPSAAPGYDDELASEAIGRDIDYFQGRAIKTDLRKDYINPQLYDRDAGDGTFQRIVESLRAERLADEAYDKYIEERMQSLQETMELFSREFELREKQYAIERELMEKIEEELQKSEQ